VNTYIALVRMTAGGSRVIEILARSYVLAISELTRKGYSDSDIISITNGDV